MWSMLTYSNLLTYFVKKKMVIYSVNMEHLKNAIDKVKNITQANKRRRKRMDNIQQIADAVQKGP